MVNLSVDGGGTKINVIAFDENYKLLGFGTSGGINTRYESEEQAINHILSSIQDCMKNIEEKNINIVYCTMVSTNNIFVEAIMRLGYTIKKFVSMQEGYTYLLAEGLTDKGYVSLSGTGSGSIFCDGRDRMLHLGGFGTPIGDDGSGAWIGIKGINAVTRSLDAWGEETTLTKELLSYLGIESNPSDILNALYPRDRDARALYAKFAVIVGEQADLGDNVARSIVLDAGNILAEQIIGVVRIHKDISVNRYNTNRKLLSLNDIKNSEVDIYACGGAWKCSKYMFDAFSKKVKETIPNANCKRGIFDPVVGGIIQNMFDNSYKVDTDFIKNEYKMFYTR